MPILKININARLLELLEKKSSGQVRQFLLPPCPKKKLENQVYLCNKIMYDGFDPYMEVKFVSQYSAREKRIEVVGIKESTIHLFQFSNRASFDQDANELNRLIQEISIDPIAKGYSFIGSIIVLGNDCNINTMKEALNEMHINVGITTL